MSGPTPTTARPALPATWPLRLVRSLTLFLVELIKANLRVASEVATPGFSMQAAILAVPTRARNLLEAVLLANAVSLTPGTLTLEVDEERRILFVHALYAPTRDEVLADIRRLEDLILDVTRLRGRGTA
jgi:multicomponent Na+:H+ antiporter subunit E